MKSSFFCCCKLIIRSVIPIWPTLFNQAGVVLSCCLWTLVATMRHWCCWPVAQWCRDGVVRLHNQVVATAALVIVNCLVALLAGCGAALRNRMSRSATGYKLQRLSVGTLLSRWTPAELLKDLQTSWSYFTARAAERRIVGSQKQKRLRQ